MKTVNLSNRPSPSFNRNRLVVITALAAAFLAAGAVQIRADQLVGVHDGHVSTIAPSSGAVGNELYLPPTSVCGEGISVKSMAKHPGTGALYAITSSSNLSTINPANADVTVIDQIEDGGGFGIYDFSTLTFGPSPSYTLYGIRGGSSASGGDIYTINITTAVATPTSWTTAGGGSHALEFNPDDGMLYHFYSSAGGGGTDPDGLEKINTITGASTPVALSGASYGAVNGIVYAGAGSNLFYAIDVVSNTSSFLSITTAGVVTKLANFDNFSRSLELGNSGTVLVHTYDDLIDVNPTTGAESNTRSAIRPAACSPSLYSIARNPDTGLYYVITDSDYPDVGGADELAMLNVATGAISNRVSLNQEYIAGITIGPGPARVIYGVMGNRGSLGKGTIVTVNPTTGAVTDTGWASDPGDGGGHSLEFNPDDGLLYHFFVDDFGNSSLEKINPANGTVTAVGAISGDVPGGITGVVYAGGNQFYGIDGSSDLHIITSAGAASLIGSSDYVRGLELVPAVGITVEFSENGVEIPDGDTDPSGYDGKGTYFGAVNTPSGSLTRVFTIRNDGTTTLNLTGPSPVSVSGSGASHFSLGQPGSLSLAPGATTTFDITFDPSADGYFYPTVSIASDDPSENPYTFDLVGEGATGSPDIAVSGDNGDDIPNGDTTPNTNDGTDFGTQAVGSSTYQHYFYVENDGNTGVTNLSLTGMPRVSLTGPGAASFQVVIQPDSNLLAPYYGSSFRIIFAPTAVGVQTATVTIPNNDPDEMPYNFDITGTGTPGMPEITVVFADTDHGVPDGDTTPTNASDEGTDFGSANVTGGMVTRDFVIYNDGNADLNLTGNPNPVSISGAGATHFSIDQPSLVTLTPVGPGAGFSVTYDPSAPGVHDATIIIANNDSDEHPYDFSITGTGTAAPVVTPPPPVDPNAALKASLSKKIKKLKKKIKAAKKKGRRDKAKRLTKPLKRLLKKLRAL